MDLYFILTPFKLSLNLRYKEGNTFLTYLCPNILYSIFLLGQSLQKTVRKCVELEQVIVTFRLKIVFQNKHGVKLNEMFFFFTK